MKKYIDIKNFDDLRTVEHGEIGSESRLVYEQNAHMFIVSEMLKAARKEAKLTQEQLAKKTGTKKKLYLKN
ncbi:MAG: hypothetical protein RLZZ493_1168 [Bacteroidota bacterium]|jgi:predicted transcriptional regulator